MSDFKLDGQRKKPGPKPKQAVGKENIVSKFDGAEKVRQTIGKTKRLDASLYLCLPEYENKTLFWVNDMDGDIDKWIHLGAEPVPRKSKAVKKFAGLNDKYESEWEYKIVGSDEGGNPVRCYLMVMEKEEYQRVKIDPITQRNKEIVEAMGIGKAEQDSKVMPEVKGLRTYAPNLPTGGVGFEQEQGHEV